MAELLIFYEKKYFKFIFFYLGGTIPETEDMNNYLQRSGSSGKLSENGALMGHFTLSGGGGMLLIFFLIYDILFDCISANYFISIRNPCSST